MPTEFSRFRVVTHTGDDNKDRDNGVIGVLLAGTEVIFAYGPVGGGLVYREGDDNDWNVTGPETGLVRPLRTDEISKSKLVMSMSGDDGDWVSAFSMFGFTPEGHGSQLLSRTGNVKFKSGHNNHYEFSLTANTLRADEETIEVIRTFMARR